VGAVSRGSKNCATVVTRLWLIDLAMNVTALKAGPNSTTPKQHKSNLKETAVVFDAGQPVSVSDSLVLENPVIDFPSH
jgi:hypothetical protein